MCALFDSDPKPKGAMGMTGFSDGASFRAWRVQSALAEVRGALALGLYSRAKRAVARAIALGWRTSSAYRDLAIACAVEGRWDEASRALALGWQFARSAQEAFDLLRVTGWMAFRRGEFCGAVAAWQQALVLRPEWADGWYRIAVACARAGAYRAAEAAFHECGRDGDSFALAAACAYLAGMPRAAARHLRLAARRGVSSPRHARGIGALAVALGERQLAITWARACESDARFAPVALEIRALMSWMDGDASSAACLAKKAVIAGGQGHAPLYLAIATGEQDTGFNEQKDRVSSTMDVQDHRTNGERECDAGGMDHRGLGDDGA